MKNELTSEFLNMVQALKLGLTASEWWDGNAHYSAVLSNAIAVIVRNENEIIANATADLSA